MTLLLPWMYKLVLLPPPGIEIETETVIILENALKMHQITTTRAFSVRSLCQVRLQTQSC